MSQASYVLLPGRIPHMPRSASLRQYIIDWIDDTGVKEQHTKFVHLIKLLDKWLRWNLWNRILASQNVANRSQFNLIGSFNKYSYSPLTTFVYMDVILVKSIKRDLSIKLGSMRSNQQWFIWVLTIENPFPRFYIYIHYRFKNLIINTCQN